jgi:predicted dithiol-disulfide oxidoreductase (DUF899 family)
MQAGEWPGMSVFVREGARVFHTYSTYTRGLDLFMNTYNLLDLTPLGRNFSELPAVRHVGGDHLPAIGISYVTGLVSAASQLR